MPDLELEPHEVRSDRPFFPPEWRRMVIALVCFLIMLGYIVANRDLISRELLIAGVAFIAFFAGVAATSLFRRLL